jgi:hypothetical protein
MAGVFQDGGLERKMADIRAAWNTTKVKVHTYSNNFTPTTASILANFTENTYAGYAAQDISNWGAPSTAAHVTTIQGDPNTFTRSTTGAAENVYGYFVTDQAGTTLYYAEKDPGGPRVLTNAGDSVTITPKVTDQSL